jgi:hypothetical protein
MGTLPGGWIALNHGPDYGIRVIDSSGRQIRTLARADAPRAVTRRDQEAARDRMRERLSSPSSQSGMNVTNDNGRVSYSWASARPPSSSAEVEEQVRQLTFADVVPMVAGVIADVNGVVWIQRTDETGGPDGAIDLVRASGEYIGTVRGQKLPDAVSRRGLAAYVERDELDVPRLVVRRLPRTWR